MGNRLSIDGVIFKGSKEINPANPYTQTAIAGGVRVQWSPTDIEVLAGSSATTEALTRIVYRYHYNVTFQSLWSYNRFSGVGTWAQITRALYFDRKVSSLRCRVSTSATNPFAGASQVWNYYPSPPVFVSDSNEYPFANLTGRWVYAWIKASDNLGFDVKLANTCVLSYQAARVTPVNGWVPVNSILSSDDPVRPFISGGGIISISPICGNVTQSEIYGYRVTTNTGATSSRTTTIPPSTSLLAGNCGITVNYLDGTNSPLIEFPTCPVNVFLVEDEICPNACNLASEIIKQLGG